MPTVFYKETTITKLKDTFKLVMIVIHLWIGKTEKGCILLAITAIKSFVKAGTNSFH